MLSYSLESRLTRAVATPRTLHHHHHYHQQQQQQHHNVFSCRTPTCHCSSSSAHFSLISLYVVSNPQSTYLFVLVPAFPAKTLHWFHGLLIKLLRKCYLSTSPTHSVISPFVASSFQLIFPILWNRAFAETRIIPVSQNHTAALLRVPLGRHLAQCRFIIAREAVVISDVHSSTSSSSSSSRALQCSKTAFAYKIKHLQNI